MTDSTTTFVRNAQKFGMFFVQDEQNVLSCGVPATRVFADTEFSRKQIIAIKAIGALNAGNMYYKDNPDVKYGWFDVAV